MEVDAEDAVRWVAEGAALLDVREPGEVRFGYAEGALLVPMRQVQARLAELPRDRRLVVYCAHGVRSYGIASYLREQGFDAAWSLTGGFDAWAAAGGATNPGR